MAAAQGAIPPAELLTMLRTAHDQQHASLVAEQADQNEQVMLCLSMCHLHELAFFSVAIQFMFHSCCHPALSQFKTALQTHYNFNVESKWSMESFLNNHGAC